MNKQERKRLLDQWLQSKIINFHRDHPMDSIEANAIGPMMLQDALEAHDPHGVEFGLSFGFRYGFTQDYLYHLHQLAGEDWHHSHEDIALILEFDLPSPESIDVLYRMALDSAHQKHAYLDYDEAFALGTKCIWALRKIETLEAVSKLSDLLHCGEEVMEAKTRKRLKDLLENGKLEEVRSAARQALKEAGISETWTEDE